MSEGLQKLTFVAGGLDLPLVMHKGRFLRKPLKGSSRESGPAAQLQPCFHASSRPARLSENLQTLAETFERLCALQMSTFIL